MHMRMNLREAVERVALEIKAKRNTARELRGRRASRSVSRATLDEQAIQLELDATALVTVLAFARDTQPDLTPSEKEALAFLYDDELKLEKDEGAT